ncbi:unnamed protein product [Parnassius apollo]|uniref:(apollo) hypothetical protein n=1 Tax=Parnassius apollo TaxID=110799 RepID=A0A8S3XMA5_PARAO|nr:unnamed protein product [Parnassius apollo]
MDTHNKLKILQCNLDRCKNAQHEILLSFMAGDYDIALISEPYIGSGEQPITDSQETAKALLDHFYPDDSPDTLTRHHELISEMTDLPQSHDDPAFTQEEVLECLKQMSPKKAPGLDNFTSDICQTFATYYPRLLTDILNRCLTLQHFPDQWKTAYDYVRDWKVILDHAGRRVTKTMSKGCIQGSTCGPVLWNIILDELLDARLPAGCHIQAFADDVLLVVTAASVGELESAANLALHHIVE